MSAQQFDVLAVLADYSAQHGDPDDFVAARAAAEAALRQRAVPTLPIDVRGQWFDVPVSVHLHVIALREQLAYDFSGQPFIRDLLAHTEHCLSAADEGVEYAVPRKMLDAMTAIGLMEKVGRGRWAPTDAAEKFVRAERSNSAQPATSVQDRLAIKLLVAAGFVSEAKANDALNIAHGFAAGPLEPAEPALRQSGEAVAWIAPKSLAHLAKQNGVAAIYAWNCASGDERVPVYLAPPATSGVVVDDAMVDRACVAAAKVNDGSEFPAAFDENSQALARAIMRAALTAALAAHHARDAAAQSAGS